jgi:hypothetical protein
MIRHHRDGRNCFEDSFSSGDIALLRALELADAQELEQRAEAWRLLVSVGCNLSLEHGRQTWSSQKQVSSLSYA